MALAYCIWHFPNPISCSLPLLGSSAGSGYPTHLAMQRSNAARGYDLLRFRRRHDKSNQGLVLPPPASLPEVRGGGGVEEEEKDQTGDGRELGKEQRGVALATAIEEAISPDGFMVISACVVGLLTGMGVVLFNNTVHEIRDFFWDGIPARGASWLREEPAEKIWQRVILVPVCGGVMVGILNSLRSAFDTTSGGILSSNLKAALKPFFKALAASITLGTGNSLGPEGPSVEIGASIAKGVGNLFERSGERRLSLVAAGSAAGIASGFNAAVAGCFFAVESVLWPSPVDSSSSLTNTTSMVILSAVIASVVSEVGLGSDPAFTVPDYDFRSPSGTFLFCSFQARLKKDRNLAWSE